MNKSVEFKNSDNLTLRGVIYEPKHYDTVIIFLHGFPARCKDIIDSKIGFVFEKLGYLFLCFDFNGTGSSDGNFEDKLMSKEVKDIKYAIDFLYGNYKFKNLILIGHSTGAVDAALYSYKDRRINKLILVGCPSNLKKAVNYDFNKEQINDFKSKGYIIYKDKEKWTYNKKLKRKFYDEFFKLDILGSIKKFKNPVLIIQGDKDEYITLNDADELCNASNNSKLVIIKGADHKFSRLWQGIKLVYYIKKFIKE